MHTCFRLCLRFSDAAYGWYVYACFLTQTSSPRFPSQTLRFSGFMNKAPSIQWRDHAGFAPASILAFYPAARKTPAVKPVGFPLQSAEKKEHKSSSVFSFSKKYFIIKALRSQAPSRYFSAFMRVPAFCAASAKSAAGAARENRKKTKRNLKTHLLRFPVLLGLLLILRMSAYSVVISSRQKVRASHRLQNFLFFH